MIDATYVVKRPLITEKTTWESGARNRYSFEVAADARKADIKRAIESLYSVKVVKVSTQMRKGKLRRTRYGYSQNPDWKRATVQLAEDHKIDLF